MKKVVLLLFVLAAAVFFLLDRYVMSVWTSYHNFEGRCLDCHLVVPMAGEPGTLKKDITVMCVGCHRDVKDYSHPVDVRPRAALPVNFPLDWKGEITCVTCHSAHDRGYGDFHLRVKANGAALCQYCHSDMEDKMHKAGIGSAHINAFSATKYDVAEAGIEIDEVSFRCLTCHDALIGSEAFVESGASMRGYHENNNIGLSHPIGVSYYEAKRKYQGAYRDIDKLPPQIRLFDGAVGCGTCHNPYSKRHFDLVMSNEVSALCLACHVK